MSFTDRALIIMLVISFGDDTTIVKSTVCQKELNSSGLIETLAKDGLTPTNWVTVNKEFKSCWL